MRAKTQKKLMNVYLFLDQFKMLTNVRDYITKGPALQEKRLHKLMKSSIPFILCLL